MSNLTQLMRLTSEIEELKNILAGLKDDSENELSYRFSSLFSHPLLEWRFLGSVLSGDCPELKTVEDALGFSLVETWGRDFIQDWYTFLHLKFFHLQAPITESERNRFNELEAIWNEWDGWGIPPMEGQSYVYNV